MNRVRGLEIVSIATTALAFAMTVWLVTIGAATEVNPWAAGLLDALGWSATGWAFAGVLAVGVEAACFAYLQRHQDEVPRGTLIGGTAIATVGVADLGLNLLLLSELGLGSLGTFYVARYLPPIAVVLVAGVVATIRPDPRPVVSVLRGVTNRLSGVEARSVALAVLVVTSMFVGAVTLSVGPLPVADEASAATNEWTTSFEDVKTIEVDDSGSETAVYAGVVQNSNDKVAKLNPSDGSIEWTTSSFDYAISGIAVSEYNGDIYAHSKSDEIARIDADTGNILDSRSVSLSGDVAVNPDTGTVYSSLRGDHVVQALSPDLSTVEWSNSYSETVGPIAYDDESDVVVTGLAEETALVGFEPSTGNREWTTNWGSPYIPRTLSAADGSIYAGEADTSNPGALFKYDAANGQEIWNTTASTSNEVHAAATETGGVHIAALEYGTETRIYNADGSVDQSNLPAASVSTIGIDASRSSVWYYTSDGNGGLKAYSTDVTLGQEVSGSITNDDGSAVDEATIELRQSGSVVKSTTTNSSGGYTLSAVSDGDYTVRASANGYQNKSKSITVSGSPRTVDFTLQATNPPYVASRSPNGGFQNLTTSSITLEAVVEDDEGDDINATIYYNDGVGSDGYQSVESVTNVAPGTAVSTTVQPEFGLRQQWKVELSDGANTVNSSVYAFRPPGKMNILNGSDFTLVDSTTATVTFADADGSWSEQRTTNDGQVNLTGLPKPWVVSDVSASGFQSQQLLIDDRAGAYFPVLYQDGNADTYTQCFQLDDFTGNYKSTETGLKLQQRVDGEYETVASSGFNAAGEICFTLEDGAQYRVVLVNLDGDSRSTGDYEANDNQTTVRLPIYQRGSEDPVRTTLYTWDAYWTEDADGNRGNISWSLSLDENVSAENVTLRIYERGNESNVIHNQSYGSLGTGANVSHLEVLTNQQRNQSWVVAWTADVDNGTGSLQPVSASKVLGAGGEDQWPALPDWLGHYAAMALLLMIGASVTSADIKVGLLIVPALAGLLWFAGLLTSSVLTGGAVALALGLGAVLSYSSEDQL